MKIIVARSRRNEYYPYVIKRLRDEGHDVYDFRNPPTERTFFSWSDIDPEWESWSTAQFRDAFSTPIARAAFHSDMCALRSRDALLLVLPCGDRANTQLGWATGARKITIIYDPTGKPNPELMYLMCDAIVDNIDHAIAILERERRFIA